MTERPVADASPLIFLARAGILELLRLAGPSIAVPAAVATEVSRRGRDDPTARALVETPWLQVVETPPAPPVVLSWDLGPGESSVLAWCLAHPGAQAIVDDLAARRFARSQGIPVRGTLGLVLLAKQRGHLSAARPVLESLKRSGMYLSNHVLDSALERVGE